MIKKKHIAYLVFTIALCYIVSPRLFEKKLLFNELLAAIGFFMLGYKRFKTGDDTVSRCVLFLLLWSGVHVFVSLFRMDALYYYLRNAVIVYSIFAYFIGYFLLPYLRGFVATVKRFLQVYTGLLLFVPVSPYLFDRYGVANIFPALFKDTTNRLILPLLVLINFIYAFTYNSATSLILVGFYLAVWIAPGYRFFKQLTLLFLLLFTLFFVYIQPSLDLVRHRFSPYNDVGILDVIHTNRLLAIDPNSTWRLVFWNQIIVDHFPANLFGLGFGTPVINYYPVEDVTKIPTLPYVLGAHNSFVYLFGRLGIVYVLFLLAVYIKIFKEYFYYKKYYYRNKAILIFFSFFAVTIIALFNPVLESPLYAAAYWLLLGFLAKAIRNREVDARTQIHENTFRP